MADTTRLAEALGKAQAAMTPDRKRKGKWHKVSPLITVNRMLIALNLRLISNHIALGEEFSRTLTELRKTQATPLRQQSAPLRNAD